MPAPITGQITVSGTAQRLSLPIGGTSFTIKASLTNTLPVYIGPVGVTTSTGYQLDPGEAVQYERNAQSGLPAYQLSISDFYVVGTSPNKVSWLASP